MKPGQHPNSRANLGGYQHPFKKSTVRQLSEVEAAWLGAMVEGEGSIPLRRTPQGIIRPSAVTIYSSEVETIATCLRLIGDGLITYRPPRPDYISPRGRQAFAKKDNWAWEVRNISSILALLPQILPFLTGKKESAELAIFAGTHHCPSIRGSSCHPSHFESGPLPSVPEEEVEHNWKEFHKEDRIDPRAIKRQHKFKPGHEPDFLEPSSGWKYVKIEQESDAEPDQRDMLGGGPPSGLDCERCGEETRVVGSMSVWEQYQQKEVDVVNIKDISEERKKELQEQRLTILKCPSCFHTYQWFEEFLPKKVHND